MIECLDGFFIGVMCRVPTGFWESLWKAPPEKPAVGNAEEVRHSGGGNVRLSEVFWQPLHVLCCQPHLEYILTQPESCAHVDYAPHKQPRSLYKQPLKCILQVVVAVNAGGAGSGDCTDVVMQAGLTKMCLSAIRSLNWSWVATKHKVECYYNPKPKTLLGGPFDLVSLLSIP